MENPTPFDLNEAIRRWQENLGKSSAFKADNLEELASHLRASVQKLKATGLSEKEAFQTTVRRMGERGALEREFAKVNRGVTLPLPAQLFWGVAGLYLLQVVFGLIDGVLWLAWQYGEISYRSLPGIRGVPLRDTSLLNYLWASSFSGPVSVVIVLMIILGGRISAGSWSGFGAFIRVFDRPIRTALILIVVGLTTTVLPEVWLNFLMMKEAMRAGLHPSFTDPYGVFDGAVNVFLVLTMVLLARQGLRKMPPARVSSVGRDSVEP